MDTMNNKSILIVIGSLVGIFAFLYVVFKLTNVTADYSKLMTVTEEDHAKWSPDKKHVLVEYSDFQCPACKNFNDLFNTFEASGSPNGIITKKVTLVFRHYPLYQIHENAFETAYAVEAASAQGKFFEMADAVFKDQAQLTDNPQRTNSLRQRPVKRDLTLPNQQGPQKRSGQGKSGSGPEAGPTGRHQRHTHFFSRRPENGDCLHRPVRPNPQKPGIREGAN
jgi:hypothetical protein